jgi:molecular chaperone DnaK (HSP70)
VPSSGDRGPGRALQTPFEQAVKDWGKDAAAIDNVIPVGGSTRMPMIRSS